MTKGGGSGYTKAMITKDQLKNTSIAKGETATKKKVEAVQHRHKFVLNGGYRCACGAMRG